MSYDNQYIGIPIELWDAYNNKEITASMWEVMVWLYRRADWSTGIAKRVTADAIFYEFDGRYHKRTIQDAIQKLESTGRITSHHVAGRKGSYWITINNYVALIGAQKNSVLNPKDVEAYKANTREHCADTCTETLTDGLTETLTDVAPIHNLHTLSPSSPSSGNEGRKEEKEGMSSFASLTPPASDDAVADPDNPPSGDHGGRGNTVPLDKAVEVAKCVNWTDEDIHRVAQLWHEHTGLFDAYGREDLCASLLLKDANLFTNLELVLKDCPKTSGIKWLDFEFFVENYVDGKKTLLTAQAWERKFNAGLMAKRQIRPKERQPETDTMVAGEGFKMDDTIEDGEGFN